MAEDTLSTERLKQLLTKIGVSTTFKIPVDQFKKLDYKREIQELYSIQYFPRYKLRNQLRMTASDLNSQIAILRNQNRQGFLELFREQPEGVGPGEVLLYYIHPKATLQGGSASGNVIIAGVTRPFECKAVPVRESDGMWATDVDLGNTVDSATTITAIRALAKQHGITLMGERTTEITNLRKIDPKQFDIIENSFRDIAIEHFNKFSGLIVFRTDPARYGDVAAVKKITKDDIFINRITRGHVRVNLKLS